MKKPYKTSRVLADRIVWPSGIEALISPEDAASVGEHFWYIDSLGYARNDIAGRLHRFLMRPGPGLVVDHINRNKLDNRRENLRVVTQRANVRNRSLGRSTSGVIGVWCQGGRWIAEIHINRKKKYLGSFSSLEEAQARRKAAEAELWGTER